MATRSEQFHADAQRAGRAQPGKNEAPAPAPRESARSGEARIKRDATLNLREEMLKGSPTSRYRKERAKRTHPRGG